MGGKSGYGSCCGQCRRVQCRRGLIADDCNRVLGSCTKEGLRACTLMAVYADAVEMAARQAGEGRVEPGSKRR